MFTPPFLSYTDNDWYSLTDIIKVDQCDTCLPEDRLLDILSNKKKKKGNIAKKKKAPKKHMLSIKVRLGMM